eukprot:CAMPEP_0168738336 /NCGR_PEP_ID=MMETSP0724-20121128/10878_1 /TAXON_ID=265536 /ORGANISM="Amphiprora sp., Strain CCMP467" /LENGTH=201 /DNA_ID=CAMNT_0008785671 /DNA_START=55 /DNA_END=660 /DNA_ORIENTATION=-
MKSAIFASLIASAAAFAPSQQSRSTTALNEFCKGYVGGDNIEPMWIGETGSKNFDPAGFTESCPEWVPWFREAELKHGRVSMLACLGALVPEVVRVPGEQFSFESIPKVIDAHDALPDSMIQIFAAISYVEATSWGALANMNEFDRAPGDFGFDPLKLKPSDPEKYAVLQMQELKNGRLAMIGISGIVAGSLVSGHGFPYF